MARPNLNIKAFGAFMPTSAKKSSGFGGKSPYVGSGNPTASRVNIVPALRQLLPRILLSLLLF